MAAVLPIVIAKDHTVTKDQLFNRWLHFTDPQIEEQFRIFSCEDCREKMLIILCVSIMAMVFATLVSLVYFLKDSSKLWELELRLTMLAFLACSWFFCRCSLWRPWYVLF